MPIYEYRCNNCRSKFSQFYKSVALVEEAHCTECGSGDVLRLVSAFGFVKSEESRLESLGDESWMTDVDESDPKSVARWARRMRQEMGEDLGPELEQMADQMASGEMPEEMGGGDLDDGGLF